METRDKILEIVRGKGPVLPVQISKEIGSDILMASAHLAELTASNRLKISTIKVGGSPLYYLPGQEPMLQKFIDGMNDKERKAFDLLQQSVILRDIEQEPVIRVALRGIKDFAIPLNVNYNNNREIFWKGYLTTNEEAEPLINSKRGVQKPIEKKLEEQKQIEPLPQQIKETAEKIQKHELSNASELERTRSQLTEKIEEKQKMPKEKTKKYKPREKEDNFLNSVTKFFERNKINMVSSETIKKNSEIDFILEIPSVVGNLQYYCKARNKKRISDSDLSNAYVKGQMKRLPVIVLSPGDLSAKAQEMIGRELNNLTFKKI